MESDDELARSLPQLGLQFLSQKDYFLRNFELLKHSAAFDIKQDVQDCIQRMQPFLTTSNETPQTAFAGWSRYAVELQEPFEVTRLQFSELQSGNVPLRVEGKLKISLQKFNEIVQREWNALRDGEVLFLLQIVADSANAKESNNNVLSMRGCSLVEIQDENGNSLSFNRDEKQMAITHKYLNLVVSLDPSQYAHDTTFSFNLLMRRNPRENNFKWTLEWIRDCIQQHEPSQWMSKLGTKKNNKVKSEIFPHWLVQLFLGYGNAQEVVGKREPTSTSWLGDAVVNEEQLRNCFPDWKMEKEIKDLRNLKFDPETMTIASGENNVTFPPSYVSNQIPFTPLQISSILSGTSPGISLIVGPPGTGKTDVTCQIIKNLYLSNPKEKILIISHSNYALNLLFQRLQSFDPLLNPLEMTRLGHGEEGLAEFQADDSSDFSKYGRMNAWLEYKERQLEVVKVLCQSLGYAIDYFGASCENAKYFFEFYIAALLNQCRMANNYSPFSPFMQSDQYRMETENLSDEDSSLVLTKFLDDLQQSITDLIPLEILRNDFDRARYCLSKYCRIFASTSTFLSLKRTEFTQLDLSFSSLIIEEAGQILDVECALALSLAGPSLQRLVMIGDHRQLPPIIKSKSLTKNTNFDQSLFVRLIKNEIPYIQLDQQARCRPEICSLFSDFYRNHLQDMENHSYSERFQFANPCLLHTLQFINVPDLNGQGESEPLPHYYQNLAEAEWIVATYQYLRLAGYPTDRIAILSPYNGQAALIQEILKVRCSPFEDLFGADLPVVSTVDRFQGRQADFVLLSLVRTNKSIGHLADIRRFVVAMSRARLGLYIFGRKSLFVNKLNGIVGTTLNDKISAVGPLQLVEGENYFEYHKRKNNDSVAKDRIIEISDAIQMALAVNQLIELKSGVLAS